MNPKEREQQLLSQLETTIEHSHRLQLALLGMMRQLLDETITVPDSTGAKASTTSASVDLPDKPTFSVREAASLLGVSRDVVYECAQKGDIPTLRMGRRLLIPRTALARMLNG